MTDSVTVSLAYKRSMPNNKYENVTPFFSATLDVVPDESAEDFQKRLDALDGQKDALAAKVEAWLLEKIEEIDADAR